MSFRCRVLIVDPSEKKQSFRDSRRMIFGCFSVHNVNKSAVCFSQKLDIYGWLNVLYTRLIWENSDNDQLTSWTHNVAFLPT